MPNGMQENNTNQNQESAQGQSGNGQKEFLDAIKTIGTVAQGMIQQGNPAGQKILEGLKMIAGALGGGGQQENQGQPRQMQRDVNASPGARIMA